MAVILFPKKYNGLKTIIISIWPDVAYNQIKIGFMSVRFFFYLPLNSNNNVIYTL